MQVQEALGHLSADPLCILILPGRHHRRQCTIQHRLRRTPRHNLHAHRFIDQHHSKKLHVQCGTWLVSVETSQNCPQLPPLRQFFPACASRAASAASPHNVLTASTK